MTSLGEHSHSQGREEQRPRFNPSEHLLQIRSGNRGELRDYLPVQWRLVWFRELCPQGTIETEMVHLDLERETEEEYYGYNSETRRNEKMVRRAKGFVIFRAVVRDGKGGVATGTKSEKAASFPDFIEKAETGAIGRALAALGFGTQFAPELDEEHRIVDSPVERAANATSEQTPEAASESEAASSTARGATPPPSRQRVSRPASGSDHEQGLITDQQLASIRKLCDTLGKPEPNDLASWNYGAARELILQLSREYRQRNESRKAS
ncbi:MAG: hypothetical protein IMW90_13055 [Thermogemmatispora sp.]|jgi:hypothetical protein|uniref:Uncharacterized protein n=1 Tax=Thermogemmatispora aurantia TaxID=2045279 RepID=A0A5J4K790_9CHLR|nr:MULTISPECIES: hypothetical protein [Thermogemmatispora]MBE3566647.1 hypothetical protein [Thermogemmatispora sp.]GER82561.1 hypothetical protein KTAU_11980 [Thermogemmatispora aurantia]